MTAQDIITSAMRLLGAIDAGGTPSTSELADGLTALNDMLDSWSIERLNVFTVGTAAYSLTSGTAAYTIGSGGNFNAARPVKIETAGILLPSPAGSGNLRFPLRVLRLPEWQIIVEKAAQAAIATDLYFDNASPLANVSLYPTPTFTGTMQVELGTWQALSQFPDQTTAVSFPPGFAQALRYNLAVKHAPEYDVTPSPIVIGIAQTSLAAIRALNASLMEGGEPPAGPVNALDAPAAPAAPQQGQRQ
jgi:hypothetical protein